MKEKRGIRSAFRNTMIVALLACVMALVPFVATHAKFENYSEGGTSTNNDHTGRYSGLSRSYLIDGKDGGFQRLEYRSGDGLFVERYTADFSYIADSKKSIEMELPLFAGFYESDGYYFLVFGQNNMDESDTVEVIRVVKYDKSWNKLGAAQIFGANTQKPFASGNVSMADDGTNLYLRTCHTMYKADDGYNHQASIMMKISISDMEVIYNNYTVANVDHGYVSHSFSQDIFYDDSTGTVYATDRGDAYPRSHVLMKYTKLGSEYFSSKTANVTIMSYGGETGDNYTGSYVSGLEVTGSTILSAGCSIDQSNYSSSTKRNVYVAVVDKSGYKLDKIVNLSAYAEDGTDNALRPWLVRVSDDVFAVLWETDISKRQVHYAFVDARGNILASERVVSGTLSDMKPIVKGGSIIWYVTRQSSPVFYMLPATPGADIPAGEAGDTAKINGLVYTLTKHDDGSLSAWVTGNEPGEVSITRLQIPDTVAVNGSEYTVDGIGDKALSGLGSMYYAEFGAGITHFGNNIFDGCTSLTTIKNNSAVKYTLPSSLGNTDKYLMYWKSYNSSTGSVGSIVAEISGGEAAIPAFTSNKVTYKFNTDGGSAIDDITAFVYQPVKAPADPVKKGYVFGGWFRDSAFTQKWDFEKDSANISYSTVVTLYAKWTYEIELMEVITPATNTVFNEHSKNINPEGLVMRFTYSDGDVETVTYGQAGSKTGHVMTYSISAAAYNNGYYKAGQYTITIEYEGCLYDYDITIEAYAGNTPIEVQNNSSVKVELDADYQYYKFVPEHTGKYQMYTEGKCDTYGILYEEVEGTELIKDDDSGENHNFMISYTLEAGKAYYLKVRPYNTTAGKVTDTTLAIRFIPQITEVILENDGQTTYMEYVETGNYSSAPYYMADMKFVVHYETGETENIENGSIKNTKIGNASVSYEIRKDGQKVSSVSNLVAGSYEKCLLIGGELKYSAPFTVTPISDNDLYEADRYYDNDVTDKMVVYGYTATKTGYVNVEFEAKTGLTLNKLVDSEGNIVSNDRRYYSYGSGMRTVEITFQATEGKTYYIAMNGFKSPYTMRIVSAGRQNRTNIKSLTVGAIETQLYNGSELKPQVEVKNGTTVLAPGKDYEVVYKDNVNAGTATAEIRGMGAYGFRTFAEFKIRKKIGDCEVVITGDPEYTGSEVIPGDVKVYDGDRLLACDTDYSISYKDNVYAGTGTVTITGMGLYVDTVDKKFVINKASNIISSEDVVLSYGGVSKPVPVNVLEGAETVFAIDDRTVATVDESGDITPVAIGSTKLTITAKETENYRQTSTVINVTVEKGDINGMTVYRAVKAGEETEIGIPVQEFLPALNDGLEYGNISVDVSGRKMPDHITGLSYEDGRLSIFTDSELADGDIVTGLVSIETDNYNVTDAKYVIETGTKDIQSGELTGIVDKEYTGESITQDVTVLLNGAPLNTTYYEVTYENNKNAGTATVVVYGRNGYSGTLRGTFTITPVDLQNAEVKLEKTRYEYTGSDICPVPEVIYNGIALVKDKDYILIYNDNKEAGTATVTVKGTGNYTGDISVEFTIVNNVPQLGKVSGIKATPAANTMKLEWSRLADAQGYIVYRYSTASHKWERLGSTKNLFYYDRNLPSGTTQWYVVRGYVIADGKTYMGPCDTSAPVKTTTLPGAVNFKLSSASKGQVDITWSTVTGATSYAVYYKTSANGKWQRLTVTKSLKYSKTGFKSGSTYYFTVRAYRQYGSTGYPGAYSAKTVKIK
ncbi:putative phage head-tail adaptor [Coprococcus sp. CAG:782]|nr:putative phage head-tail adaptor [Coprococcus sp. CAG:782]